MAPMAPDPGIQSGFDAADQQQKERASQAQQQSYLSTVLANARNERQQAHDLDQINVTDPTGWHPDAQRLMSPGANGSLSFPKSITNDVLKANQEGKSRDTAITQQSAAADAVENYHHQQGQPVPPELVPFIAQARSKTPMSPKALETMQNYLDVKANAVEVTNADGTKDWVNSRTGKVIAAGRKLDPSSLAFPGSPAPAAPASPSAGAPAAPVPPIKELIAQGKALVAAGDQETDPVKKANLYAQAKRIADTVNSFQPEPASVDPSGQPAPAGPMGRNGLPIRPDEHPYDPTKRLVPVWDDKLHAYRPTEKSKDAEDLAAEAIQRRQAGIGNDPYERILVGAIDAKAATSFGGVKEGGFQRILDTQFPVQTSQPAANPALRTPGAKPAPTLAVPPATSSSPVAGPTAGTGPGTPYYPKGGLDQGYAIDGTRLGPGRYEGHTMTPPAKDKLGEPEAKIIRSADEVLDNVRAIREGLKDPAVAKELLGPQGFMARSTSTESSWKIPFIGGSKVPAVTDLSPKAADIYARLGVIMPTFVISREGGRPSQKLIELGQPTQPNLNNNINVFNGALDGMERASIHSRAQIEKQGVRNHQAVSPYEPLPMTTTPRASGASPSTGWGKATRN